MPSAPETKECRSRSRRTKAPDRPPGRRVCAPAAACVLTAAVVRTHAYTRLSVGRKQRPDLQNILRQSYDYLTIMPKLRSTYYGRLINKTSHEGRKVRFTCRVVRSSETVFANQLTMFLKEIFDIFKVTIVSRSYDKLTIVLR